MDRLFELLFSIRYGLHTLAGIAIIAKMILVFRSKGFNLPAYVISFFRVYTNSEKNMTHSVSRQNYMRLNNLINYYLYVWLLILVILFLVFHTIY